MGKNPIQRFWIEDPNVCSTARANLLDIPAGKHHDRSNHEARGSTIIQQICHPPSLSPGLNQGFIRRPFTRNPEGLAVIKDLLIATDWF